MAHRLCWALVVITIASNALTLIANGFVNTIIGDLGKNVIDGKGGADTMQGMAGDDNYQVDNPADKVIEAVSEGIAFPSLKPSPLWPYAVERGAFQRM